MANLLYSRDIVELQLRDQKLMKNIILIVSHFNCATNNHVLPNRQWLNGSLFCNHDSESVVYFWAKLHEIARFFSS